MNDKFFQLTQEKQDKIISSAIKVKAKYWHYSRQQEDFMVEYSKKITKTQYVAWFQKRIYLDELPEYTNISIPMLAVCGKKEVQEMIHSTRELGRRNPNCRTLFLDRVNHDFPLRNTDLINPILLEFIS